VVEIFDLIDSLIRQYSSDRIPIDGRHTPKVYARFMTELVSKHRRERGLPSRQPSEQPSTSDSSSHGPPSECMHVWSLKPTPASQMAIQHSQPSHEAPAGSSMGAQDFVHIPESNFPPFANFAPADFAPIQTDMSPDIRVQALNSPSFWDNMMLPGYV
jgi:hypothetical protein